MSFYFYIESIYFKLWNYVTLNTRRPCSTLVRCLYTFYVSLWTYIIYNNLHRRSCNIPFFSFTVPLNISFLDMKFHILKASFLWVLAWHRRSIQFMYRTRKIEFWLDCSGLLRICSWGRQPSRLKTLLREFFVSPSSYIWKRKLLLSTDCVARLVQHCHVETRTSKSILRYWITKEEGGDMYQSFG